MDLTAILDRLIGREGGYSNHPSDRGGETMWGITATVARRHGYGGAMARMPRAEAIRIYNAVYVIAPGFDRIAAISPAIAEELIDTGVNMGPAIATQFLQRALNALNRQARDYPDIAVDGDCGGDTRNALTSYLNARGRAGVPVMLKALNALQGERYIRLAEGRAANEDFLFGWLAHRVA